VIKRQASKHETHSNRQGTAMHYPSNLAKVTLALSPDNDQHIVDSQ